MVRGFYVLGGAMVLCVGLGVIGWLSLHHIDTAPFLTFLLYVAPTVVGMFASSKASKIKQTVENNVMPSLARVEEQTNGALTTRIETAVAAALLKVEQDHNKPDVTP
jgi:hypothetical protein